MASFVSRTVESITRPEYTGDNRCLPCTAVNLVIAGLVSLAVGVFQPVLGVVVLSASVSAIYLRGYLVPGTPTLTKRYLPERVLRWFGKAPEPVVSAEGFDIGETLRSAGVLVDDPSVDDFVLESRFAAAWTDRTRRYADANRDGELLVEFLGIGEDELSDRELVFEWQGPAFVAVFGDERIGRWESRSAFVADVAAAETLRERWDGWTSLPLPLRGELLGGLRLFLETCPTCDGTVSLDRRVVESCCRSYDVVAATCEECGDRLFESNVAPSALEPTGAAE